MKRAATPGTTVPSGWLRGLWPDHNPLRRTCDRAEAAIVAGLIAAFLIAAPVAGLIAGQWAYNASLRAEYAQPAAHHQPAASQAALGAVLTVVGLGLVLGCGGVLSHRALDKRRLAAWEAGWRTTGPQWTSRH